MTQQPPASKVPAPASASSPSLETLQLMVGVKPIGSPSFQDPSGQQQQQQQQQQLQQINNISDWRHKKSLLDKKVLLKISPKSPAKFRPILTLTNLT